MPSLVIIGTIALDTIRTPFGSRADCLGGTATFAGTAASFFTTPGLVSVVGSDFPAEHLAFLQSKADTSGVQAAPGRTFRWSGSYEYDMNEAKTLDTQLNVLAGFAADVPASYRSAAFVFLGNIDPALQLRALQQFDKAFALLDTMNYWIERDKPGLLKAIAAANGFICNEWEARQLFDTPNLVKAAKAAQALGPDLVIIKKGEHGALVFANGDFFAVPGYPLENVIDPTGSGDSFAGGFLGFLARAGSVTPKSIRQAAVHGSIIASYNAEGFSLDRLRALTHRDIEKRYAEFRRLVEF